MNPLAIRAENYRTFERLDLDLPAGCCAIVGDNGAGKSSLVNVIDLALFGPATRSWAPYLRQGGESTELLVELVFEHRGDLWRVRRGYSARGRGKATLDLEEAHHPMDFPSKAAEDWLWTARTRESIEATQKAIDELLGLSRETFRASAFLAQGDGAAFTEAQPRERKRILAEVLGLGVWDRLLERARADRRGVEDELQRIAGRLSVELEEELAQKDSLADAVVHATHEEDDAKRRIVELEEKAAVHNERAQAAREALEAVKTAEIRLAAAKTQHAAVEKTQRDATLAEDERSKAQAALESAQAAAENLDARKAELVTAREQLSLYEAAQRKREEAAADAGRRRVELTQRIAASSELSERVKTLRASLEEAVHADRPRCDRCTQLLEDEALSAAIDSLHVEITDLEHKLAEEQRWAEAQTETIRELTATAATDIDDPTIPDVALLERQIDEGQDARVRAGALVERIAALTKTIAAAEDEAFIEQTRAAEHELITAEGSLEVALSAVPDPQKMATLAEDARSIDAALAEQRRRLAEAIETRARAEQKLTQIEQTEERARDDRQRRAELQSDVDVLAVLERAYGRDGIPSLIVSSVAIPQIETEASRILAELGTSYRVELRTEKALRSGSTADALDVVVITETGERPYETFSGGERTRLNLALRIALARLLAHRRGAESALLAIDEPEFLDAAGTAALAGVLRGLESDFERIYLISHVPDLREAFEQTLEVVKDGDASRVAA